MNKNLQRRVACIAVVSIIAFQANNVLSHQLINSLTSAHAVDHFVITCAEAESHHLYVLIDDRKVVDDRQFNVGSRLAEINNI